MIRAIFLISLGVVLVFHQVEANHASAGGSAVGVFPYSGPLGTPVQLTGSGWLPDMEVSISAGFTEDPSAYGDEVEYGGVIATTTANDDGKWRLEIIVGGAVALSSTPGFVHFRADPFGLPPWLKEANTAKFALVVGGQRPVQSGELRITVTQAPGLDEQLVFLAYRRAGSSTGFNNRIGVRSIPAYITFESLADGDIEIAALATGGLRPSGPGLIEVLADVCDSPTCEGFENTFTVQRVSIRNSSVVNVSIFFADAEVLPNGGSGPPQLGGWRWAWVSTGAGLAFAGALLTLLGAVRLRSRRPAVR